ERSVEQGRPLERIKELMPKDDQDIEGLPFTGGAIGYIGYDAIAAYEPVESARKDSLNMPDLHLQLYETIVVFDHVRHDVTVISFEGRASEIAEQLEQAAEKEPGDRPETLNF